MEPIKLQLPALLVIGPRGLKEGTLLPLILHVLESAHWVTLLFGAGHLTRCSCLNWGLLRWRDQILGWCRRLRERVNDIMLEVRRRLFDLGCFRTYLSCLSLGLFSRDIRW